MASEVDPHTVLISSNSLDVSESGEREYSDQSMADFSDEENDGVTSQTPTWLTVSDMQKVLHPLQAAADRLGDQVEKFAENLDRMNVNKVQTPQKDCRTVLPLVQTYRSIAKATVKSLEKSTGSNRQGRLDQKIKRRLEIPEKSSSNTEQSNQPDRPATRQDLSRWKQEEQTWHLLELMLQVEFPLQDVRGDRLSLDKTLKRPGKFAVHQYSSEKEVWDCFLANDDLAWERHTVVEWLKECAEDSDQDIASVVKQLENDADRGDGLWAHSWLYTKEAIKFQKRLRSWPRALNPDIEPSLMNSERTKPLVTQLDPDASSRQDRNLELKDQNFERATWLACWEMVRRGNSWDYIRDWCQERVDGWRAIAMRGDPRQSLHGVNASPSTGAGWHSRLLWRKICALNGKGGRGNTDKHASAQGIIMDKYEAAVYGILGGYLPSVLRVCGNWNDYLFGHYNSFLLRSFDNYILANFPERLSFGGDKTGPFRSVVAGGRTHSGNQLVEKMKTLRGVSEGAKRPFKMLQGSLIGKSFESFAFKHGVRLSLLCNSGEKRSKTIPRMDEALLEDSVTAEISTDDHQMLRVITHMIIIFKCLGLDLNESPRGFAAENFIVAYIEFLSKAGKQQLLPLYASCLSPQRALVCLGKQLPSILDNAERLRIMQLMRQNGIDVPSVLNKQLQMIVMDSTMESYRKKFPNLKILEDSEKDKGISLRRIRPGFLDGSVTNDQQDLISGFEWYLLLDGHWQQTMATGAVLYRYLLKLPNSQGLAAAREIFRRINFESICEKKMKTILDRGGLIHDREAQSQDYYKTVNGPNMLAKGESQGPEWTSSSSDPHSLPEQNFLLEQSNSFRNFEDLIRTLGAMEKWQKFVDTEDLDTGRHRTRSSAEKKEIAKAVRRMYRDVEDSIQLLLHGWLQNPRDNQEAEQFDEIRAACLPEVVLAYHYILNLSARYISRDLLLRSMDLSATIAREDSDVAAAFVSSGRMPELVDSFALLATGLLAATETSGKASAKLGMWSIKNS